MRKNFPTVYTGIDPEKRDKARDYKERAESLGLPGPFLSLADLVKAVDAAERQLVIDNTTPPEVDAWNDGNATQADDDAVWAGIAQIQSPREFYQRIVDDLSDELRDETLTPAEAAEITEQIKVWQARIGIDVVEKEVRATHESALNL